MNIKIMGRTFHLEILIFIGLACILLVAHVVYICCPFRMFEGFDGSGNALDVSGNYTTDMSGNSGALLSQIQARMQQKMQSMDASGNMPTQPKEGFTGANTNYGESSSFDLNNYHPVDTSSWNAPDMTVVPGQPLSQGVKTFLARDPQPVPLPEGEMLMFANTPFKPECCPNTYSNGSGCACMTGGQYNYLVTRGSNNLPYSEY